MDYQLLLHPKNPVYRFEHAIENITKTFFKCTQWQVEETTDPITCPYHYFCDSSYPGDYPCFVDILVAILTVISYLIVMAFTLLEMKGGNICLNVNRPRRRYWLPSGPVVLPFILLALAKGHQVNTIFPLSNVGPALLQLVLVSALAFENTVEKNVKYVFFEVSTVSGILHASLYLDSIILPYYTGLEALAFSTFSGECVSCVCRREVLVVGGSFVVYRGLSGTTFSVVGTLCSRLMCRHLGKRRRAFLIKFLLEGLSWILISIGSVRLMMNSPRAGSLELVVFGSIFGLVFLHVLRKVFTMCFLLRGIWCKRNRDRFTKCDTRMA